MNGEIGSSIEQGTFDLCREESLARDGGERTLVLVAGGAHLEDLDLEPGVSCSKVVDDQHRLGQRET
ncbi:MAG: hypothetical protein QOG16_1275 [Actinomycetota bacterium]|jgi:hypothetical protein|nr:hypothetical protein [Actinomycetota bacterium]